MTREEHSRGSLKLFSAVPLLLHFPSHSVVVRRCHFPEPDDVTDIGREIGGCHSAREASRIEGSPLNNYPFKSTDQD